MSTLKIKAHADLLRNPGRTALLILNIAIGLLAVCAIFGMVDMQLAAMDSAHRAVHPAHLNIILRQVVSPDQLAAVRSIDGIATVEPAAQLSVRYRLRTGDPWKLGILQLRADYAQQELDRLGLDAGVWPVSGGLAAERLTARYLQATEGAKVEFETAGEPLRLPIAGILRSPFVKPPRFGGPALWFASRSDFTRLGLPETAFNQLLLTLDPPYSLFRARQLAATVEAQLAAVGIGIAAVLYQDPDRHWGRLFVEGIDRVLQIMAAVCVAMTMVLVLNSTQAFITRQVDQIGTLKALGGRLHHLLGMYLYAVFVISCAALLVAVPAGCGLAWGMTRWFLDIFNIDFPAWRYSPYAVGVTLAIAWLAPALAALWPILRGATMTVREALSHYGLEVGFGRSVFDRAVEWVAIRILPAVYAVALANVFRRKSRLFLTQLGLIVAGVWLLAVMSLNSSIDRTLSSEMSRMHFDVRLGLIDAVAQESAETWARQLPETQAVEVWRRCFTTVREATAAESTIAGIGVQLVGMPSDSSSYRPLLVAGRWLDAADEAKRQLVLSAELAERLGLRVGSSVGVNLPRESGQSWEVIGLYRLVYGSDFAADPAYAPAAAVERAAHPGCGSQVLVSAGGLRADQEADFADRLKTVFAERGMHLDDYSTIGRLERRAQANAQYRSAQSMLLGLVALTAAVGAIGLSGALSINVLERRQEIGVMRALGARAGVIMRVFLMEGLVQAVLAWLVSVPLGYAAAQPLAKLLGRVMAHMELEFAFATEAVGWWLAIALTVAVMASIGPALGAARLRVKQCLNEGRA